MSKDDNYTNVILEEVRDQNKKILEMVSLMGEQMQKTAKQESIDEVKNDLKIVKAAVTDQGAVLADHETRITSLETA